MKPGAAVTGAFDHHFMAHRFRTSGGLGSNLSEGGSAMVHVEDEIAAAQAHSDELWAADKVRQMRPLRCELAGWLIRGDSVLY
jgi:hypothetical protein